MTLAKCKSLAPVLSRQLTIELALRVAGGSRAVFRVAGARLRGGAGPDRAGRLLLRLAARVRRTRSHIGVLASVSVSWRLNFIERAKSHYLFSFYYFI